MPRYIGNTPGVKPFSNFLCTKTINIKRQSSSFLGDWPIMEQPGLYKNASVAMASNADTCKPAA
ncbi:DNA gyrase subunit A protein [Candidatus Micropelagos thuwalensis]|uniref:DNA gyrase subunit A protein n=1 Tax=Candidatus Micropelagius thuwalensis TaxID=1397666 RepID=U2XX30_9PROT|nr:DNA gyrase subunit A protein [Candidatus Micropelagos thuwalensis]